MNYVTGKSLNIVLKNTTANAGFQILSQRPLVLGVVRSQAVQLDLVADLDIYGLV